MIDVIDATTLWTAAIILEWLIRGVIAYGIVYAAVENGRTMVGKIRRHNLNEWRRWTAAQNSQDPNHLQPQ